MDFFVPIGYRFIGQYTKRKIALKKLQTLNFNISEDIVPIGLKIFCIFISMHIVLFFSDLHILLLVHIYI